MRIICTLALAAFLAACTTDETIPPESPTEMEESAGNQTPVAADATTTVAPISYRCDSGRTVEASYPSDSTAVLHYDGQRLQMTLAESASGARYVGRELEWWTKGTGPGSEGTLFRHESGTGTTGESVESCVEAAP